MTIYVVWPKEIGEVFCPSYFETVQEAIQSNPLENAEGTHYMVGSSRITSDMATSLEGDFPNVYFGTLPPEWWQDKNS